MVFELQVNFVGLQKTTRIMRQLDKRFKTEPNKMTEEMAITFKRIVRGKLISRSLETGTHSTPTKLSRRLRRRKFPGGHFVKFDRSSQEPFLPEMVEFGTPAHDITSKTAQYLRFRTRGGSIAYAKSVRHPGARPKHFWRDSVQEFNSSQRSRIAEKYGKRIVGGFD